jgi:hypothetical protein
MVDMRYESWAALQEMTAKDVADAIDDSQAIVEAIRSNDWSDVADLIRARVELKAKRMAEFANDLPLTLWVDSEEELALYRFYRQERLLAQFSAQPPKINPYEKRGQQ